MDEKNLKNIEMIFNELKKSYKESKISKDQFITEAKQLGFKDSLGKSWRFNGEWFTYDDGAWVRMDPYQVKAEIEGEIKPDPTIKIDHGAEQIKSPEKKVDLEEIKKNKTYPIKNIFIAIISVIIIVFLIIILVKNSKKDSKGSDAAQTSKNSTKLTQIPTKEVKIKPTSFQFSSHQLVGTASYQPLENQEEATEESSTTNEINSKVMALVDCFLHRVRIIHGLQMNQDEEQTTQKCQGNFLGFFITQTLKKKGDETVTDEVILHTPTQGKITIKNSSIISMKNTDYTRLIKELNGSGLGVEFREESSKQQIIAELKIQEKNLPNILPDFLISHNSVGKISLGESIQKIEIQLPVGYFIIKRSIQNKYEGYKTYLFHKVYNSEKQPMFIINSNEKVILKIQIENENYKTIRGIKVGDNLGKLRAFYPDLFITIIENQIPYAYLKNSDIRFYLQLNKIKFDEKIFPMDSKIVSIWLENND